MLTCMNSKKNGTQNKLSLFFKSLHFLWKAVPLLILIVFASELIIGLIQTITLVTWQHLINNVDSYLQGDILFRFVLAAMAANLGAYMFMDVSRMLLESFYTLLNYKLEENLQMHFHEKCRRIPVIYFENSDLYNEIDRARNSIDGFISLVQVIGIFIMAFGRLSTLGTYVFFQKPIFAWIVLLPILPVLITRMIRGRDLYRLNYKQSEKRRECEYYKSSILNKETKTLRISSFFLNKWDTLYRDINLEEKKTNKKVSILFLIMNLLKYGIYIFAIIIAVIYLYEGSVDIGTFVLITGMLGTTHATIEVVVSKSGDIAGGLLYAKDYFFFLDKSGDIPEDKKQFQNSISLKNVCFKYPNAKDFVLQDINLTIQKGEKIALVGINGAGKSTLSKIIAGLYAPSSGMIYHNQVEHCYSELVDCSIVFQNFCKYYVTLREAVAFGDMNQYEQTDAIIGHLSRFEFDLKKTNDNLDTMLGRDYGGVELSGGEWQKIALARGFLKESELVILDEPNSNLDPAAENKMFEIFLNLLKHKTGIIITHRIGIACLADRIILLNQGRIIEDGTHEELMNLKNGSYKQMFESQANLYQ